MKSITLIILSSLIISLSFAQKSSNTCYSNIREFKMKHPQYKSFILISQEYETLLGVVDTANYLKFIQANMDGFLNKYNLIFSPDYQYILIESIGEGHPFMAIFKVDELVNSGINDSIKAIGLLDPYPYWFNDVFWLDNKTILFISPIDFSKFDKELHRGVSNLEKAEVPDKKWKWTLGKDIFEEVK